MHAALKNLTLWDRMTEGELLRLALEVAGRLPPVSEDPDVEPLTFILEGIRTHTLGDQQHRVVHYRLGDGTAAEFALIPGGSVELGYDRRSPGFPTKRDFEGWKQYLAFDFPELPTNLDACMSPLRQVVLSPFLIEVTASERSFELAHCEAVEPKLAECGFRLPSSDEWEFAYSGGTRSVFPWGNDPTPPQGWPSGRNAFGLRPPKDSYCWELCSTPLLMRGGDGGVASCGGWGGLVEAITRACAYMDRPDDASFACFRRAMSVAVE